MFSLLVLLACKDGPTLDDSDKGEQPTVDATWYADVKPIVDQHCVRCHNADGLGVGDFTNPDEAAIFGERMVARVEAGEMPPPTSDPGCRDFEGSEHMAVDEAELDTLRAWVDGGKALGDPADDPQVEVITPELTDPDLTLLMSAPYTPTWWDTKNAGNEYRCFLIDPQLTEDTFVTAMHPIVDQDPLVHHIVLYDVPAGSVPESYFDPEGFDCINGSDLGVESMLVAWAPGMMPIEFPEGSGLRLKAGHLLAVQMHYFRSGSESDGVADQSGYAFRFTDSVQTEVFLAPLGIYNFRIPAGDEAYTSADHLTNEWVPLTLYGVFPHMHRLGSSYRMWMDDNGDETCLLDGQYDFDNQLTYMYKAPVDFPVGVDINYECTWNNSTSNPDLPGDEPVETRFGERTDEEMCFFFSFVSAG